MKANNLLNYYPTFYQHFFTRQIHCLFKPLSI